MATEVTQCGDRTSMNEGNILERWIEMKGTRLSGWRHGRENDRRPTGRHPLVRSGVSQDGLQREES